MSAITAATVSRDRLTRETSDDRKGYLTRDTSDDRKGYLTRDLALALTPSDTSIDDSVKSGYHLKHMPQKQSGIYIINIQGDPITLSATQVHQAGE